MRAAVKFLLAVVYAMAPAGHAAPPIEWASHLAGANFQIAGPVLLSPAGNVYFTGHAGAGAVFGTNSWTATNTVEWFLAKHDPAGRLLWIQSSTRIDRDGISAVFDPGENLYIAGAFSEHARFGNFVLNGVSNQLHIFLVKFQADGDVAWAKAFAQTESENSPRLARSPAGDLYLARTEVVADEDDPVIRLERFDANGNPIWQQPSVISTPYGANLHNLKVDNAGNVYVSGNLETGAIDTAIYFLSKFGLAGDGLWTLAAYGTDEDDKKSELGIDSQGFIYIAGEFMNETLWGTNVLTEPLGDGVFLAKVNPAGDVLWARNFPGTLSDFDLDAEGNSYLAGDFSGTVLIGTNSLTSRGSSDLFLARFDRQGALLWVRQAGGTGWDHSPAVSLDQRGNVFLSGFFFSPVSFGPQQLISHGMSDIFVAKYNRYGKFFWAEQFGGPDYDSPGTGSEMPDSDWAVDPAGNVYFSGSFWESSTVGTHTFDSLGQTDVFFAKLAADPPETLRLLPPIVYTGAASMSVEIAVTGTQGRAPIHIQASPDLNTWTSIYTQAVPSQIITFTEPLTSAPAKFYRAVAP